MPYILCVCQHIISEPQKLISCFNTKVIKGKKHIVFHNDKEA